MSFYVKIFLFYLILKSCYTFFNKTLLRYLIECNKVARPWVFSPLLILLKNLDYTLSTSLLYLQIAFLCYEKCIKSKFNYLVFCYYFYKSKNLECKEEIYEKIIRIKEREKRQYLLKKRDSKCR